MLAEKNADPKTFSFLREDVQAVMDWIGSRGEAQIAIEKDAKFELETGRALTLSTEQFIDANLSRRDAARSKSVPRQYRFNGPVWCIRQLRSLERCGDLPMSTLQTPGFRALTCPTQGCLASLCRAPQLDDANLSGANLQEVNSVGRTHSVLGPFQREYRG